MVPRARLERGIELGQIRSGIDVEVVLEAIYGPVGVRLLIGHAPREASDAAHVVDVAWCGIGTTSRKSEPA